MCKLQCRTLKLNEDGTTDQKQVYKTIAEFLPKWKNGTSWC